MTHFRRSCESRLLISHRFYKVPACVGMTRNFKLSHYRGKYYPEIPTAAGHLWSIYAVLATLQRTAAKLMLCEFEGLTSLRGNMS